LSYCLIALGSNLGDRQGTLDAAVQRLGQTPGIRVQATSRWHATSPVGGPAKQQEFLNGAVLAETSLAPKGLLAELGRIEAELGRCRAQRWGPRTLDLDLLLYDNLIQNTPTLILPHPRMAWRRFVLGPAVEVAPEMIHPTTGWTIAGLLFHLDTALPYLAITGPPRVGKTWYCHQISQDSGAQPITIPLPLRERGLGHADSSSILWELELEFLQARARLLASDRPDWKTPGGLWVSDFWFGQSLAYAKVNLPSDRAERFRHQWEEVQAHVVAPKLIVLVEAPVAMQPGRDVMPSQAQPDPRHELWQTVRLAIAEEACRSGRGPLLRLDANEPTALDDLLAAVEGIR